MNKKIKLIFAILTLFNTQSHCADALPPEAAFAQDLVMIFDVYNDENPKAKELTISSTLTAVIVQQVPFIVSPSFWHNFIARRKRFADSPFKAKFQKNPKKVWEEIKLITESRLDFGRYATPFNPQEWVVKKIENIAYIFVPTKLLQQKNAQKINIPMKNANETIFRCYGKNNTISPKNLTKQELLLGLKIDHCVSVANPLAPIAGMEDEQLVAKNQKEAIENFDWSELFVTRKDLGLLGPTPKGNKNAVTEYNNYQKALLDQYKKMVKDANATMDVFEQYMRPACLYLTGHGNPKQAEGAIEISEPVEGEEPFQPVDELIANLSPKQLLKLLSFCNFFMNTWLLHISTCFIGGEHTDPTFQYTYESVKKIIEDDQAKSIEIFKKIPLNLNFIVIAAGLTDVSTTLDPNRFYFTPKEILVGYTYPIKVDNVQLFMETEQNFTLYFEQLKKYFANNKNAMTLPEIVNTVDRYYFGPNAPLVQENISLVLFPGTEKFQLMKDTDKYVNIINQKTMLESLQQKKPLTINKDALLVYNNYIPNDIILTKPYVPVVPMNTAESSYFFEKIQSNYTIEDALKSLSPNISHNFKFYIGSLQGKLDDNKNILGELGNLSYQGKRITLNNVVIEKKEFSVLISFTFNAAEKPHYYQEEVFYPLPEDFEAKPFKYPVGPEPSDIFSTKDFNIFQYLFPIDDDETIKKYLDDFTAMKQALKGKFETFEQTAKTIEKNLQEKIKKKTIPQTPELSPMTNERKLINSLNALTESLTQLKKNI